MKKHIIMSAMLVLMLAAAAQDTNKFSIKPYGFIRSYLNFDSRQTYTVIGGEYNMLPFDEQWNEDHTEDLNAVPHTQLQALSSRFGVTVGGPVLLGMRSSARLEGDFGGFGSNNTLLRLRLAYVKLEGDGSELLIGQDWHPMSGSVMPDVLGMAAGAPFRPHSRTPQLRGTAYRGHFGFTGALLWQLQFMNNGPASASDPSSVASTTFANNALLPEVFVGLNYRTQSLFVQLGADYQVLRPRTHALVEGVTRRVDERVSSFSPTLYAQYVGPRWSIKFRTLLAENTSHLNQLVGYAVTAVGPDGTWYYSPLRATISYLNLAYGRKWKANLFFGYMKNLGSSADLHDFGSGQYLIYMKGGGQFAGLNSLYRVAPSVSYNLKAINVGLEYELTAATYGDLAPNGSIRIDDHLHRVLNHRVCALVKYNF